MGAQIIRGNALQIPLADQSVHCIVTSPPYWGLRDYGVAGQIGLEPTFDEYLQTMLAVMRECKRVLRNDGTLWLNMGDGYATGGKNGGGSVFDNGRTDGRKTNESDKPGGREATTYSREIPAGLKPKDLIGQPWALAFALRADGWYLRSDIIWHKPAPMPESVSDRPTKAHEYLFLLSKSEKYFFDQAAWREPAECEKMRGPAEYQHVPGGGNNSGLARRPFVPHRNRRTVWTIAPQPTPEAHFATFPEALVEPCLLAGCPKYCCPTCGQGWQLIEEKTRTFESGSGKSGNAPGGKHGAKMQGGGETMDVRRGPTVISELKGYAPACACKIQNSEFSIQHCAGTAFDPFSGSGTVCSVAHRMGYNGIGLELNPAYIEIAKRRIFADVTPTPEEKAKGQRLVFAEGKS